MFYPNSGAYDYRYRARLESAYDRAALEGILVGTALQVRTGEDFVSGTRGIELRVQNIGASGDANIYHQVKLATFWGTFTLVDVINFDPDLEAEMHILGAYVNTNDCSDWSFHLDSLEVFFEGSSVYSTGSHNDSGPAFSRRMCTVKGAPYCTLDPDALFTMPTCVTTDRYSRVEALPSTIGWQRKESGVWVSKAINLDLSQLVPEPVVVGACPICGCTDTLPDIDVDDIELSWEIRLRGISEQEIISDSPVTQSCSCVCAGPPPVFCGIPWVYTCHLQNVEYRSRVSEIQAAPEDAGIPSTVRETGSKCWCETESEPVGYTVDGPHTEVESFTYAATVQRVNHFDGSQGCCSVVSNGSCPVGAPEDPTPTPPEENCGFGPLEFCAFRAYRTVSWNEPGCACEDPDIHCREDGDVYIACVDGTNIRVKHKATPNWPGWDIDVLVTSTGVNSFPCIVTNHQNMVILEYLKAGTGTMRRVSFDDGKTWSAEELAISGGIFPRVACNENGDTIRAAVVSGKIKAQYQNGGDVSPGGLFTFKDDAGVDLDVEPAAAFGLDYAYSHSNMLFGAFQILAEATASNWQSTDEGRTWTRIS